MMPYLQLRDGCVYLFVKVQPRAPRNAIGEALGNELKIKIAAPPVDSAANEELVRFLAEVLDCARGDIQLIRGQAARHKQLSIRGMTLAEIDSKVLSWRSQ